MANPFHQSLSTQLEKHPELSGIYPLLNGTDAFVARFLLIENAKSTLDIQYYIWHDDLTGIFLLDAIRRAALRGVKVRMLLDDNGLGDLDAELSSLNDLPNMEIKLYNPFFFRSPKFINFLFSFVRLNHRMHNKMLTVDDFATIIGGRNIADEYFDTGPDSQFVDTDVIAVGNVLPSVKSNFVAYWNANYAYPLHTTIKSTPIDGLKRLEERLNDHSNTQQFFEYSKAIETSKIVAGLTQGTLKLEWCKTTLISDKPTKSLGKKSADDLMFYKIRSLISEARESLDLISAYFVPGKKFSRLLISMAKKGIDIRILTNSLSATDVSMVQSGYGKYRKRLLRSGIRLFELRSINPNHAAIGSIRNSLHAKSFAIDREKLFVGSFNFDPRSAYLNTEMGLLIESPKLAGQLTDLIENQIEDASYRMELASNGKLVWHDKQPDGGDKVHYIDPHTTFWERALVKIAGWFPVEWLL